MRKDNHITKLISLIAILRKCLKWSATTAYTKNISLLKQSTSTLLKYQRQRRLNNSSQQNCPLYYKLAVPGHALLWLIFVKCKRSISSLLQVSAVQHTFGWHPVAALQHTFGWHPVAAVQHTIGWHSVAAVQHTFGWHPVAAVQHTFGWHPVAASH
jgi:hypothetical protein